jgi:transcriptional regulator with XRE-family HTH domain
MEMTREEAGRELREARLRFQMSQAYLGSKVGVTQPTVGQAENGNSVSVETMNALRSVLQLQALTGFEGEQGRRRPMRVSDREAFALPVEDRSSWELPGVNPAYPHWQFPDKRKIDQNVDPVQGEFFTPEGLVDALIRESIQNSLDAQQWGSDAPVMVRFALYTGLHALPREVQGRYFGGLWPHLLAMPDTPLPRPDGPVEFLVIEDFGTTGLTGDYRQYSDKGGVDQKNNFYYFWRNIGRSSKSETDRGRWGLGKTVFPAASRINSFFGLTIRHGETQPLLMGQSVLKIHSVEGEDFTPYGGFGEFDSERFVLPVADASYVDNFCEDFHLRRRTEPGTSIVIPFFRSEDDVDLRHLIKAAIDHYFYPILTGDLILEMSNGEREEQLTAETMYDIVDRYVDATAWESAAQKKTMFDLARWSTTNPQPVELPEPQSIAPSWDQIVLGEGELRSIRDRYEEGERLHLRVTLRIRPIGESEGFPCAFSVYLENAPDADRRQRHYIRRGITIPNKDATRTSGARGLVIIDDPLLSTVLGDAENPAHTEWNERSLKAKGKYRNAATTIRFVKHAFDGAVRLVSRPPEGLEEDLLADVFSVEIVDEQKDRNVTEKKPKRGQGPSAAPQVPHSPALPAIVVSSTKTGFAIKATGKRDCVGRRLVVRVAYEIDSGDPFKRYERFDFELNKPPIWTELSGVSPGGIDGNEAEFIIEDNEFAVSYGGFDSHRDLRVRAEFAAGGGE